MNTLFPTLRKGRTPNTIGIGRFPSISSFLDDMINDTLDSDFITKTNNRPTMPAVNIIEKDQAFEVEMAIPGFNKSDFNIDVDKELLTISSERTTENEETSDNFTRREFGYASFKRSFHLPETVNKEEISASYIDGILKVNLPKNKEEIDKGIKQIEIS